MKIIIFEPDAGMITATQTGGIDKKVLRRYRDSGQSVQVVGDLPTSLEDVFVRDGRVAPRPPLRATIDKTVIRADGQDVAKIRGVPRGALVRTFDGLSTAEHRADGSTIHIVATEPAVHEVTIEDFPHLRQSFILKAV